MTTIYAKVKVGYENYVLPIEEAQKLFKILATYKPVEEVTYSLVEFRPELEGMYVEKSGRESRISIEIVDKAPMPYFDQQEELRKLREEKYGPELYPFSIKTNSNGKFAIYLDGEELESAYSYRDMYNRALERKVERENAIKAGEIPESRENLH